jgi:hypothetical protein
MKNKLFLFIFPLCLFFALNGSRNVLADFDDLPPEVTVIILNDLTDEDLAKMSLVNKNLNIQASGMINRRLNELYSKLKRPYETRSYFELTAEEQIYFKKNINNFRALERLDQIQSLEGHEIQDLLNQKQVLVPFLLQMFYKQNLQAIGNWISDQEGNSDKNDIYFAAYTASYHILSWGFVTAETTASGFLTMRLKLPSGSRKEADTAAKTSAWSSAHPYTSKLGLSNTEAFNAGLKHVLWRRPELKLRSPESFLTSPLTKLGLKTSYQYGNTAYDLAELVTLNEIVKKGPSTFLYAFEGTCEKLNGSIKAENFRKKLNPLFGKKEFLQNPFMQSLDTFLVQLEELLGICTPKDEGTNSKRCYLM